MIFEDTIYDRIKENQNQWSQLRRCFHQIPELGFQEIKTTDTICQYLKEMNIEPIRLEPTGVVAYLGQQSGPVLALRADIDALAVTEDTGLEYTSQRDGFMHACGHDGHIAGLLGAAQILKNMEKEIPFRVKLIFQPSEENTEGAKRIIQAGVLEDVDAIFGLHLFSDIPYGIVNVQAGPRMAQTDRFRIVFEGKGGHAGKPHLCVDSTVLASEFVMSAQTIVAREINPVNPAVVTIGSFHSGTQYNIISPKAELQGTCRSFDPSVARQLKEGIERRAHAIAESYRADVEIEYEIGSHPPVVNHEGFSQCIEQEARKILTGCDFEYMDPLMLGEDFSWYQDKVPGVFAFVGCGKIGEEVYPNHHPKFDMEERALSDCIALHLSAVKAFKVFNA